jgi:adenylate kinase family enzyme
MRIAIFGTHNVGKTSLAEDLLEKLPGYTLEMEPYFQLESSGYEFSAPQMQRISLNSLITPSS